MPDHFWLTPMEVADDELGVHVELIYDLIDNGEIAAVNVARDANGKRPRWRISKAAVQDFIAQRALGVVKS